MKEINVSNFSHLNVKSWIGEYSHKEKVELAIYCAELVINLYKGESDAPRLAIEAAKEWVKSPTKENRDKCNASANDAAANDAAASNAAAYAAYAASANDAAASNAAAYAAYAAYAADAAAYAAYAAAYAADAAYAAAYAADAAYAAYADKPIKEKIINYISSKLKKHHTKVKYVKCEFSHAWEALKAFEDGDELYRDKKQTLETESVEFVKAASVGGIGYILTYYKADNLYYRIETEIDERQEFIDTACQINEEIHGERRQYIIESLYDSGKFKLIE